MSSFTSAALTVVTSLALLLGSAGAHAAKKKAGPSLNVAVLPLPGDGPDLKEAIELELELVDKVGVVRSAPVEGDLKKAGARAFVPKALGKVLSRRKVDVLVRTTVIGDVTQVVAYGKDGRPRFFTEVPVDDEPAAAAKSVVEGLKPLLKKWKTARVVTVPKAKAAKSDDAEEDADDANKPSPTALSEDPVDGQGDKPADTDSGDSTASAPTSPAGLNTSRLGHTLAISGAFDGATWFYSYDAVQFGDNKVLAAFYPGGSLLLDVWPLAWMGVDWVGVDAEVGMAAVPFEILARGIEVTPGKFVAIQTRVASALKLRYTLGNGIGLGGRLGYRYFGAAVEPQTVEQAGVQENLTVVPGFTLHALSVGAEVFVPILIGANRLELELRADGLPLTLYAEQPDNPGAKTVGLGWGASLAARYDIVGGLFAEARVHSTGAVVTYKEQGTRKTFVGNDLTLLEGGNVVNLTGGFSAGVGFMF